MEPLVEPTATRWFPPDVVAKNPPYLDKARAMIRNTPVNGFIGCAAALADHDFRSAVGVAPSRRCCSSPARRMRAARCRRR